MSKRSKLFIIIITIISVMLIMSFASCGAPDPGADSGTALQSEDENELQPDEELPEAEEDFVYGPQREPEPEPEPQPEPVYPGPDVELFPWEGVVEHLFTHEVIVWPERAFSTNLASNVRKGYDDNMITVLEFERILESLYRNGFILVDINTIWSEYTNADGQQRMRRNTLMLPEGKKPLVFSFDDISFYNYMTGHGFMERLIIGVDGEIWETGIDPNSGERIVTQGNTIVTILDNFVREHPDFSLHGAKGVLALTGYEGILGYRTHFDKNENTEEANFRRMQEIALVRPVISRLKETGWVFASHSYGHNRIDNASYDFVTRDADRWLEEVGSLVGETQIMIYPFGSRLDGDDVTKTGHAFEYYVNLGFRLFASVGREPYTQIKSDIPAVIMDRMNVDGMTLRNRRERFLRFYDAVEIFDNRRPDFGNTW